MKNKVALSVALVLGAFGTQAFANECNFKSLSGLEFEVGSVAHEKKFDNKMSGKREGSYDYLYSIEQGEPLVSSDISGRHIKIDETRHVRGASDGSAYFGQKVAFRVYSATLDNCDAVEVIIPETKEFAKWFNESNDAISGVFPFQLEQSSLQLIDSNDVEIAEAHIGKPAYLLHYNDITTTGTKFGMASKLKDVRNHEKVILDSIDYSLESGYELESSQFSLVFKAKDGERVNVPFNVNQVMYSDPALSPNVQAKHREVIKNGDVHYGMNTVEVFLAKGEPDLVKYTNKQAPKLKGEFNPHSRFNPKTKYNLTNDARGNVIWIYGDTELVFSKKGVLDKDQQNNYKLKGFHFGKQNAKDEIK
ncbi:hypothetical protein LMH73_015210 [Vibrio splendidus]|nr:hypothetical protein [Vibrio splendidus]MCC4883240.1 hypothetical protein [Vibrio splendidus]